MTPSAARLSANGSFELVGFSSIIQKPSNVSNLSARETATDIEAFGTGSFGPLGA